ncbi:CidA/LrgA family protein [Bacillus sp. 1NLA3E]|uniref:CidA/LrgA family protein n=1 Tax=Bacillus sp. 1NLA3E TaxID=666686 RepID=UPI000247E606|nr:CidA/LrgA family protein [Bacillus sp. 1NLA3E]AGK54304.1 LrgA family protein [Bacillus sp. 1NLA3E]
MLIGKYFIILLQLCMLMIMNKVGFLIVQFTHIPIPGNVMGMLVLFFLLCTKLVRINWIEHASSILINHLSFFFIPISVGLMTLEAVFMKSGIAIIIVLMISTVLGIIISGSLSQALLMRKEAIQSEYHRHHL